MELATAFTAEWWLQGRGYGVDGRIEVLHKGEVVIAVDAPKGVCVFLSVTMTK